MSAKIKKGDDVIVLSGKDKGKTGKILKIIKGKDKPTKAIVEGANIVKKHTKQSTQIKKNNKQTSKKQQKQKKTQKNEKNKKKIP